MRRDGSLGFSWVFLGALSFAVVFTWTLAVVTQEPERPEPGPTEPGTVTGSASSPGGATGSIRGTVELQGDEPERAETADSRCPPQGRDDFEGGRVANAMVRVVSLPGTPTASSSPVRLEFRDCALRPAVVAAYPNQELQIVNADPMLHVARFERGEGAPNGSRRVVLTPEIAWSGLLAWEGADRIRIGCDMHPHGSAVVHRVTNDRYAVTGRGGTFRIDSVPAGTHWLEIAHHRFRPMKVAVTVRPGEETAITVRLRGSPVDERADGEVGLEALVDGNTNRDEPRPGPFSPSANR